MRKRTLARALGPVTVRCTRPRGGRLRWGREQRQHDDVRRAPATRRGGRFGWRSAASRRRSIPGLATDTTSAFVVCNTNTPIVTLGPAPDLKPVPALAKSWDVNGANVTLHLRNDVKWTNGRP